MELESGLQTADVFKTHLLPEFFLSTYLFYQHFIDVFLNCIVLPKYITFINRLYFYYIPVAFIWSNCLTYLTLLVSSWGSPTPGTMPARSAGSMSWASPLSGGLGPYGLCPSWSGLFRAIVASVGMLFDNRKRVLLFLGWVIHKSVQYWPWSQMYGCIDYKSQWNELVSKKIKSNKSQQDELRQKN